MQSQEEELAELRGLDRDLQKELLRKIREGSSGHKGSEPIELSRPALAPLCHAACLYSAKSAQNTISPFITHQRAPARSPMQPQTGATGSSLVDIGQGLLVPSERWRRVQARETDSLFVKDLLVTIWDTAHLQGRSLQGKHCPRFPDRPRKEPLTPWKVSVMRTCYKRRLEKQGFPESVVQTLVKRMNHYVGEKIADIDKMAKRLQRE